MADLISQKVISSPNVSQYATYTSSAENKNPVDNEKTFGEKVKENKLNIIGGGLITGGALLFYLGLTRPGKADIFNKYIKERIQDMDSIVKKFVDYTSENIESSFKETLSFINNFKNAHIVDCSVYLSKIELADSVGKLVAVLDSAFESLTKTSPKGGATYMDDFAVLLQKIQYRVKGEISRQQHRTSMELRDYRSLPKDTKEIGEDLLEGAEAQLDSKQENLIDYMERVKNTKLNIVSRFQFRQMVDAITESRLSKTTTKETVLNTIFDKIGKRLHLGEDFAPKYNLKRYDLMGVKSLDSYLKPINIPEKILNEFEPNIFMDILVRGNLNTLSEDDLRKLFDMISEDYNLKDLRYLIDRIRLHEVMTSAGGDIEKHAQIYRTMDIKLEYLSNKLNDFGENELIEKCDFDFEKLNLEQRKAKLHYINKAARRLGYENFSIMNREMLKTNESYRALDLSKFAEEIESNPELYFIG